MWPPSDKLPLPDLPEVKSFIGVIFAVSGNILISVALNVQKNAHNELQKLQLDRLDSTDINDSAPNSPLGTRNFHPNTPDSYVPDPDDYGNINYLHSKAWWAGLFLMIIGELGNFIAYAFAPASVIAPLGTVALISNVILAPIMLKETFRPQDLLGILIAIIGAVVVVINSKSDEVKLSPQAIWIAIMQTQFTIYLSVTLVMSMLLIFLSDKIGHKLIIIDLSLVAIFGGYTVLSTKAISSLLTMKFVLMFSYPITYILLFVLVSTAVLQIRFLNKALRQFDSTEVIPTQFVLFTISAIIGSAILYNDFAEMDFWKCASFLTGCLMTFVGVYFITSNRGTKGYVKVPHTAANPIPRSVLSDDIGADRRYGTYQRPNATTIPSNRRHTVLEPLAHPSTPLLSGYDSNNNSISRNDGILLSLVHGSLTVGVSQALNSVGARHSHALGLDQVWENYWLKMLEQRSNESNDINTNGDSGVHRRSNSVPQPRTFDIENYRYGRRQNGRRPNISLSSNQDNNSENFNIQSKSLTNSYLSTSNRIYMGDSGSTYEAFPDLNHSEDMDDLPDLPTRRDYGNDITESESEI
ncbi:11201_t:CDS:2 [Dentiscutata heterogama]|uniref:11201_t:CDS:1 n=1 Tax=Dentiscutata heterogama TaxID=1316150 RepID=A0ACA9KM61_9GLOM|nr:11201_t:CDS:2 [Dentiscutata heterogama]